jgi:tRNA pseudouridine55 synthase
VSSGVLVTAKPRAVTSFDVVAAVRRTLRVRRVGHAGTLDPGGTGVLPVLIGEATKLMPYLVDQDKEYRVAVRFGMTTDTLDASGRVLTTAPVMGLDRGVLERAAEPFIGKIQQAPPMYSAVHHQGQRLYHLARRGVEVERAPRDVVVHVIAVEEVRDETAKLRVVCGKGTYVRVLVADLGAALGFGAVVDALERTRVGPFGLDTAVSWEEIRTSTPEALWSRVEPPETAISRWPVVRLAAESTHAFVHGQPVPTSRPGSDHAGLVRVHGADGTLLGVGELAAGAGIVRPVRVLHVDRPGTRVLPA